MRGENRILVVLWLLGPGASGCVSGGEARYVYQDGQFGVVGIPENTSRWPTYYRQRAEELMAQHFPEGYEIVRAEEVVEGERTVTVGGTRTAEVGPGVPEAPLRVVRLGRTATRKQSDQVKITECRILYKKKEPGDAVPSGGFAERATWTPAPYLDPNAEVRRHAVARPAFTDELAKHPAEPKPAPKGIEGHNDHPADPEPPREADAP